ncbi:MAG: hypothetical protein J6I76_08445 [Oribacterium sp.]|nr:hypothetical protein [Oribacterium sp.]
MNDIKREQSNESGNRNIHGSQTNQYKPLENNVEYISNIPQNNTQTHGNDMSSFTKRIKTGAGVLCIAGIIAMVVYGMGATGARVDTSVDAETALETHMSTTLTAGTKLMAKDESYIGGDLTITHSSSDDETTIYVWDYAAEDGDYVQIFVDGNALGDPFMIKNKPVPFKVPTVGEIKVVGTRDGGGGITYGVYYEVNQTTYFNGMNQGGNNVYTLIKE